MMSQQAGYLKTEEIRAAINNDDLKRAVKLALKLDKNDLARAMLAYCYMRMGNRDEALEICESLMKITLSNDSVLHWISLVWTSCRRHDRVLAAHLQRLQLVKPPPASQNDLYFRLAIEALFAYFRLYDFKEADQMLKKIMAANRVSTKVNMDVNKLSIWAATLGFLLGHESVLNLKLAESFLDKSNTSSGLPLKRWIQIRLGKYKECLQDLKFLPNESTASKLWMKSLLIRLCKETGEVDELLRLIADAPDDFRAYSRLCQLATGSNETQTLLCEAVSTNAKANPKLRGPRLALVRLEFELFVKHGNNALELKQAVLQYIDQFKSNQVLFSDLKNDLILFCLPSQEEGVGRVELPLEAQICPYWMPPHEFVECDRESRSWPVETISQRVPSAIRQDFLTCLLKMEDNSQVTQICRYCGGYENLSPEEVRQMGQKCLSKEEDDWVLLGVHFLLDILDHYEGLLYTCASALEKQLRKSPDNFQLKLALHEVYSFHLASPQLASPVFDRLKVKQIQLDCLGHVGLSELSNCGFFSEAKLFSTMICEFNSRSRTETAECFATAFDHSETSSPVEMVRLEQRLKLSSQFAGAIVERCSMNLLPHMKQQQQQGLFSKIKVEVLDPPLGKSAICVQEHRLARALEMKRDVMCYNCDLTVEFSCDPPFGRAFQQVSFRGGPNSRLPRLALLSKKYFGEWKVREAHWMELRCLVIPALIGSDLSKEVFERIEAVVAALTTEKMSSSPWVTGLWNAGVDMLRVLHCKTLSTESLDRFEDVEQSWSQVSSLFPLLEEKHEYLKFFSGVSTALSNAGLWVHAIFSRFQLQLNKSASGFPFDVALFRKLAQASSKSLSRISSVIKELKMKEEKKSFLVGQSKVDLGLNLEEVFKGVKRSHVESFERLSVLASSLASFEA